MSLPLLGMMGCERRIFRRVAPTGGVSDMPRIQHFRSVLISRNAPAKGARFASPPPSGAGVAQGIPVSLPRLSAGDRSGKHGEEHMFPCTGYQP
jgi:hypothetical protein